MDLSAHYPILIVIGVLLLFMLIVFGAFSIGKRKYNREHGIVKERKTRERPVREKSVRERPIREKPIKEKEVKQKRSKKSSIRLSEKDMAAEAAFNKGFYGESESDDEYEDAVNTLKAESVKNTTRETKERETKEREVIRGPIFFVDEHKATDEVIEWKPPTEDKKVVGKTAARSESQPSDIAAPSAGEWNDEDLELFEARAYSFDEKTQSGYIREEKREEKPAAAAPVTSHDAVPVFRERREQIHDPAADEGVQVFETSEPKKPEQKPEYMMKKEEPKAEPKVSNSKYAYLDAVIEKDKTSAPPQEWQPPGKRTESASFSEKPKKTSMQYIELDLEDDK